ncbi:MAG: hypothetical protein E6J90_17430 [Deltaproteobacteria bacterium]|nr:MAG: hypothetical protein E6J91_42325 [Deltaproteobacteria bacterium]TMQ19712.1 MAG: hypothetical protein E6J90_17430 [Deltaproteobacteria bacterium]
MSEHESSPDPSPSHSADAADVRTADITLESFPADLHELQLRGRTLSQTIEVGDPDGIGLAATRIALALQGAWTKLESPNRRRMCAPNANIALRAAHTMVGYLFRQALLTLRGDSASEVRTRDTLHQLAVVLEIETGRRG